MQQNVFPDCQITQIAEKSEKTGVASAGGGLPKNFIPQTEVRSSVLGMKKLGHDSAIRYTVTVPYLRELSGCTFDKTIFWDKVPVQVKKVQVFVDATLALPLVTRALNEKCQEKERSALIFYWK